MSEKNQQGIYRTHDRVSLQLSQLFPGITQFDIATKQVGTQHAVSEKIDTLLYSRKIAIKTLFLSHIILYLQLIHNNV